MIDLSDINEDAHEVYKTILEYNHGIRENARIPESDAFRKEMAGRIALNEKRVNDYLDALRAAHLIFIFNISKADPKRNILPLDGYVAADADNVHALLPIYEKELQTIYKAQKGEEKGVDTIMREYLPDMNILNNTHTGKVINTVSMLREYQRFIDKNANEFSGELCRERLTRELEVRGLFKNAVKEDDIDLIAVHDSQDKAIALSEEKAQIGDAFYSESLQFDKSPLSLEKALKIYGLHFIIRFYFSRYQFSKVEELVKERRFFDLSDLIYIRSLLKKRVMDNFNKEPKLSLYRSQIYRLDRSLARTMRQINVQ